jgi:hypothetical protein
MQVVPLSPRVQQQSRLFVMYQSGSSGFSAIDHRKRMPDFAGHHVVCSPFRGPAIPLETTHRSCTIPVSKSPNLSDRQRLAEKSGDWLVSPERFQDGP